MTDDFKRLIAGDRRAHHLLDIGCVTYLQGFHETSSTLWCHRPRRRTIQ
jgi:hypothetical protein